MRKRLILFVLSNIIGSTLLYYFHNTSNKLSNYDMNKIKTELNQNIEIPNEIFLNNGYEKIKKKEILLMNNLFENPKNINNILKEKYVIDEVDHNFEKEHIKELLIEYKKQMEIRNQIKQTLNSINNILKAMNELKKFDYTKNLDNEIKKYEELKQKLEVSNKIVIRNIKKIVNDFLLTQKSVPNKDIAKIIEAINSLKITNNISNNNFNKGIKEIKNLIEETLKNKEIASFYSGPAI